MHSTISRKKNFMRALVRSKRWVLPTKYRRSAESQPFLIQASDIAYSTGVLFMTVIARCEAALVQIAQGKLNLAAETCQQAIQLAGEKQIPPLGFAWYILAEIAWERNELASAEQYLQDGIELTRQGGLIEEVRYILMALARLKKSTGKLEAALSAIEQAHAIVQAYRNTASGLAFQCAPCPCPAGEWEVGYRQSMGTAISRTTQCPAGRVHPRL